MKRLRAELKAAHLFDHHERSGWIKLALMLTALLACCAGVVLGPVWSWLLLVPAAALATTTATLIGHEGSHGSFSSSSRQNQLLVHITLPLFAGISGMYWKHKHNNLHHGHPNVVGSDPDIELWPMAMSRAEYERSGPGLRWFQRNLQGILFWPASLTLSTFMRAPSYVFIVRQLRTRGLSRNVITDTACLVAHYALWVGVPAMMFGFWSAFAFYMTVWALVGTMLTVIFTPAHLGLPLMADQHNGWRHQLETTRNIRAPRWLAYFYVGLEYQLEHHIFPQITHQNLPRAGALMRRWCAEQGLPYRDVGWFEALRSVTVFVRDAWSIDTSSTEASSAPAHEPSTLPAHEPFILENGRGIENARGFGTTRLPSLPPQSPSHKPSNVESPQEQQLSDLVC
jgi:fatty acid desaturase